ncbi:nitrile hydratase subunit alpha [Candidatus Poribacteria bacterium]|jgi:nitrile hydratase subunit alpha|nr:nitrile hydratase subunit alpha [Candidatus Poribacteria bacterium]MBT5534609.1 nitrile hydratase subunit alpha [Candidatus Poribacteria bacterium]MBT5714834.1 nitrile hydratase subunit alpha [Candidatus Poribacteria bacterium]MBT7099156.1 nitrile hydratase subunit alpha [Candidatus Poribacteria bacterium]MBT7806820.1 nitrile hydratase subunit alpha [Candidatus Poribacteria bacterium]
MSETHTHEHASPAADAPLGALAKRSVALHLLLVEKGLLCAADIHAKVEWIENISPATGARVVARCWTDEAFKQRLLADANAAAAECDVKVIIPLVAVENTDRVHNLIVCTLCSCYPRFLIGEPPAWYKSLEYRSRAVSDPRGVLREFGLEVDADTEVRVYDSSADMRYVVIPRRPPGSEGLSEEELAAFVTRDSMIGVALTLSPDEAARSSSPLD